MTSSVVSATVVDVIEGKAYDKPKSSVVATWVSEQWKPILAEFVATTTLVFFGCMSCIPIDGVRPSSLHTSIAFGLTVMFNVQIFGHVSGAFMNPAVTLGSVISGNTPMVAGASYGVAQFLGAILGYGILMGLAPMDVSGNGICVPMLHPGLSPYQALGIEFIVTATWVLICSSLADPVHQHNQDSAPIKFGIAIVGLSAAAGSMTGAVTNPARTFAPVLWSGMWNLHWVYWAGPFLGAACAATFYRSLFIKERKY